MLYIELSKSDYNGICIMCQIKGHGKEFIIYELVVLGTFDQLHRDTYLADQPTNLFGFWIISARDKNLQTVFARIYLP